MNIYSDMIFDNSNKHWLFTKYNVSKQLTIETRPLIHIKFRYFVTLLLSVYAAVCVMVFL